MAKIKYDPVKATRALKRQIDRALQDKGVQTDLGILLTDRVRTAARKGRPYNDTRRFPALKTLTKKQRKYLERFNRTHPAYKSSRSSLTFTGQLLDALSFRRVKGTLYELYIKDTSRTAYRTGPNSVAKKTPDNETLAGYLDDKGFTIFTAAGLRSDRKILQRAKQIILRYIRRQLRRS